MRIVKNVIAEIVEPVGVRISGSGVLNEKSVWRWSSSSPAPRKIIPSSRERAAFPQRLVGPASKGKSGGFGCDLRQVAKDTLSRPIRRARELAAQIKKQQGGNDHGRTHCEHRG